MAKVKIKPARSVKGVIEVPGDKSITHRAVILGSIAEGKTIIENYLEGDDCRRTIDIFKKMGVQIRKKKTLLEIYSDGIKSIKKPSSELYAGNSGTTMRLVAGVVAGLNFKTVLTGDASLSRRPMKRIIEPLGLMNVRVDAVNGQYPPLIVYGNPNLKAIEYRLPVPSAQVKSCILLAGLHAKDRTVIYEPYITRDHTERMMEYFGVNIRKERRKITLYPGVKIKGKNIKIPGDISSAGFFIVLATIMQDSVLKIKNVGLNSTRIGLIRVLKKMGANIKIENRETLNNELMGDILIKSAKLKGVVIDDPQIITDMIDEIPVLTIAATQAVGRTIIRNARELRVKESDRIRSISTQLKKMGADITELEDGFIIEGPKELKGEAVDSFGDHRIAMALAVAGKCADSEVIINNSECVDISFPGFYSIIESISQ